MCSWFHAHHLQILGVRVLLWMSSFLVDLHSSTWDDKIIEGLAFIQNYVLQIPLFLMTFLRYLVPTMDNMYTSPLVSLSYPDTRLGS